MQATQTELASKQFNSLYSVVGIDKVEISCLERIFNSKHRDHPVAKQRMKEILDKVRTQIEFNKEIAEIKKILKESSGLVFLKKQAG